MTFKWKQKLGFVIMVTKVRLKDESIEDSTGQMPVTYVKKRE